MSKRQIIMALGAWTAVFLYLGFPLAWDKAFAIASGAIIAIAAYLIKPSEAPSSPAEKAPASPAASADAPYVEHKNEALTN